MAFVVAFIHRNRVRQNRIIKKQLRDNLNPFELPQNVYVFYHQLCIEKYYLPNKKLFLLFKFYTAISYASRIVV